MERLMWVLLAIGAVFGFVGMILSVATYYSANGLYAAFGPDVGAPVYDSGGVNSSIDPRVPEELNVEPGKGLVVGESQAVTLTEPYLEQVVVSFKRIALFQGVAWAFVSAILLWILFIFERKGLIISKSRRESGG